MVKSRLDDSINYAETKELLHDDKMMDVTLYEITILGRTIEIALGNIKYTFIDKNIQYFPIYLIQNDRVKSQIGVYEISSESSIDVFDDEGDVNISVLGEPLIYSFIKENPSLLGEGIKKQAEISKDSEPETESESETEYESEVESESESETEESSSKKSKSPARIKRVRFNLPSQKETSERERSEYSSTSSKTWIEKYLNNNNYKIVDNEGNGDCFFATIRDGLARVGKRYSIPQLRKMLSEDVSVPDTFEGYKNMYETTRTEINDIKKKMKVIQDENKLLKEKLAQTRDKETQGSIVKKARENALKFKELDDDLTVASDMIREFNFMKGIDTLEKFKEVLNTQTYWADTWAISTLERLLNIKVILFFSRILLLKVIFIMFYNADN